MSVDEFLKHVHPEYPDASIKPIYDLNDDPDKYIEYYSELKELEILKDSILTNRIKRNFKNLDVDDNLLLPTGNLSEKWYLVTNSPIETLKQKKDSFIYGKDPNREDTSVPIYAVVTLCEGPEEPLLEKHVFKTKNSKKDIPKTTKNRYIPVSLPRSLDIKAPIHIVMAETVTPVPQIPEIVSELDETTSDSSDKDEVSVQAHVDNSSSTTTTTTTERWMNEETKSDWRPTNINTVINLNSKKLPHTKAVTSFFVDYWMFYPYSAGKIMCSIDLGPLGPIPIPLVFGFCFGTKKEFG